MKQTLQSLKNRQGLESRFQLRLENLRIRNNMKMQKQIYTLSNFVFVSSYNNQFKNSDEIKRLENLSKRDDNDTAYLINLTFAGKEYPMTLRRYVHMRKASKQTLRLFIQKSSYEEYSFPVFFNFSMKGKHD